MLARMKHKGKKDANMPYPVMEKVKATGEVNLDKEMGMESSIGMGTVKRVKP